MEAIRAVAPSADSEKLIVQVKWVCLEESVFDPGASAEHQPGCTDTLGELVTKLEASQGHPRCSAEKIWHKHVMGIVFFFYSFFTFSCECMTLSWGLRQALFVAVFGHFSGCFLANPCCFGVMIDF